MASGHARHPPRGETGADERLRAWEIVDQLEAFAARCGVGEDPVTDFVCTVAGTRKRLGKQRGKPRIFASGQLLDACVIELLIDPSHCRLANLFVHSAVTE